MCNIVLRHWLQLQPALTDTRLVNGRSNRGQPPLFVARKELMEDTVTTISINDEDEPIQVTTETSELMTVYSDLDFRAINYNYS